MRITKMARRLITGLSMTVLMSGMGSPMSSASAQATNGAQHETVRPSGYTCSYRVEATGYPGDNYQQYIRYEANGPTTMSATVGTTYKETVSATLGASYSVFNASLGMSVEEQKSASITYGPYSVPAGKVGQVYIYNVYQMINYKVYGPSGYWCGDEVYKGSGTAYKYKGNTAHFQYKP